MLIAALFLTDNSHLFTAARIIWLRGQTDVGIYDFTAQNTRAIKAGKHFPWPVHEAYNKQPLSEEILKIHEQYKTLAFLVIKDGKILNENYFLEGNQKERTALWSVTKTYTSLATLKAIEKGLISNIDDPVKKYIPEWKHSQSPELTLRHLASMSAGLSWDEMDHSPFSLIAKFNFYHDLQKISIDGMHPIGNPGDVQHYNSGATQLLGTVLSRVLKGQSLSDFISEEFWQPLGCQQDALFILDSKEKGIEKAFGGMVASARDVSRLGQTILNEGRWNGQQILSEKDVKLIKTIPYNNQTYSYGIWTGVYEGNRFYLQSGFRGQYIISFPAHNLVITRLGHLASKKKNIEDLPVEVFDYIKEALRLANGK